MFDHIGLVVSDLGRGKRFYTAVLEPLGFRLLEDHTQHDGTGWLVFGTGQRQSPFFVVGAGRPSFWSDGHEPSRSPIHLALSAPSKEGVDRFHAAGLALGARDNGGPGIRRKPFYCAFLIDPDGNN
ncbi:MAG: VOC family protein, partial [Bradyrhizobium sp.]|uniref:VOC family protein n=1 Tax=Bradyrhizobium sp. TaxID=376 RepID=UPI001D9EFCCA